MQLERVKAHGSPHAQDLAAWLRVHLAGGQLVDRERYLVVPVDNPEQHSERSRIASARAAASGTNPSSCSAASPTNQMQNCHPVKVREMMPERHDRTIHL